jgi:hypothetical protein
MFNVSANSRRDDTDILSGRASTRVMHGPGGQSSMGNLIFGGNYPNENQRTDNRKPTPVAIDNSKPNPPQQQPIAQHQTAGMTNANRRTDTNIQERSSTRHHQAPGGRSTMGSLLSGGEPADTKQQGGVRRVNGSSANQQSAGNNRRDDTDIHSRASTRVLAKPGGESQMKGIIFGGN